MPYYPVFDHTGHTADGDIPKKTLLKAYKADLAAAKEKLSSQDLQIKNLEASVRYWTAAYSQKSRDNDLNNLIWHRTAEAIAEDYLTELSRAAHYKRRCDDLRKRAWNLGKIVLAILHSLA